MMIQLTLSTLRGTGPRATFVPDHAAAYLTRLPAVESLPREGDDVSWTRQGGVLRRLEGVLSVVTLALLLTLGAGAVNEAVGLWARI